MFKKVLFSILVSAFSISSVVAQSADDAVIEAKKYAKALKKGSWDKVLEYTYPKLIETTGGKEKMLMQADAFDQTMEQQGFVLKKVELADPMEMMESGDYWMCVIPMRLTFSGPLGNLYSESGVLAVQKKSEGEWKFIDLAQVQMAELAELFPDLNQSIVIPTKRIYQD